MLLIDVDPQGNLTSGVGLKGEKAAAGTIYEALMGDGEPESFVLPTQVENLFVIPADRSLTGAEIELVSMLAREHRLKRIVDALRARLRRHLHRLSAVARTADAERAGRRRRRADPAALRVLRARGLADLVGTMRRVRTALNPSLDIEGVLLTMYDDRTNLGQLVARDVREFFKDKVFNTIIPRNVRLGEAPSHGVPGGAVRREVSRRRRVCGAGEGDARASRGVSQIDINGDDLMIERRPALGKGLSALIPDAPEPPRAGAMEVDIDLLAPNDLQPRVQMDDAKLQELADSIKANGIIQPILVRRTGTTYRIIAGERRWRAAQRAGPAQGSGRGSRRHRREGAARAGARREHPAREPERGGRGAGVSAAG